MSDKKLKIFVTRRWPEAAEDALRIHFEPTFNMSDVPLDKAALMDGFASHDIAAPTVSDKIEADIIAAGAKGNCRLIANYGVGVNHIDLAAAAAEAIPVTNTPGVLTDATADLTLTLMLMLCRRAGEGERELRAGEWSGWRPTHLVGRAMTGKRLGIIGMGRIGKAVARRAALGFGMDIVFQNRSRVTDEFDYSARQLDDVDSVCRLADIISLHCAASPQTYHVINSERLAIMKRDACLINTARGDVVDELLSQTGGARGVR